MSLISSAVESYSQIYPEVLEFSQSKTGKVLGQSASVWWPTHVQRMQVFMGARSEVERQAASAGYLSLPSEPFRTFIHPRDTLSTNLGVVIFTDDLEKGDLPFVLGRVSTEISIAAQEAFLTRHGSSNKSESQVAQAYTARVTSILEKAGVSAEDFKALLNILPVRAGRAPDDFHVIVDDLMTSGRATAASLLSNEIGRKPSDIACIGCDATQERYAEMANAPTSLAHIHTPSVLSEIYLVDSGAIEDFDSLETDNPAPVRKPNLADPAGENTKVKSQTLSM